MKIKTLDVFYCEYCNKHYLRKHLCETHEKRCNKNPENWRACHSCIHLTTDIDDIDSNIYEEGVISVKVLHCNKLNNHLYPPIVEHKGNYHEFTDFENLPMPKICKDIEFNEFFIKSDIDELNIKRHSKLI